MIFSFSVTIQDVPVKVEESLNELQETFRTLKVSLYASGRILPEFISLVVN